MKVEMITKIEVDISTIEVDTEARYWEDTYVNETPDIDFFITKGVGEPRIPCAVQVKGKPDSCIYSDHWRWRPIIDAETGKILNWTKGVEAIVHYKVCDGFRCMFKDSIGNAVRYDEGYVPPFMYPEKAGHGDYIIMRIDKEGQIANWSTTLVRDFLGNKY